MPSLHDTWTSSSDYHISCFYNFVSKVNRLLIFNVSGFGPGGAKYCHLTLFVVRGKNTECIAQFPDGGLDYSDIALVFDVIEKFKGVFDDICHFNFVGAASF